MNFVIFMVSHEFVSNNVDTYASFSLLLMLVLFGLIGDLMLFRMMILIIIIWGFGQLGVRGLVVFYCGVAVFFVIFMLYVRYPFIPTSFEHILISQPSISP